MEFDFLFIEEIDKLENLGICYDGDVDEAKGLACKDKNLSIVNLSASQWNFYNAVSTNFLIDKLCQTILHETIHLSINTTDKHTQQGEEIVCRLLANQDLEELEYRNEAPKK